MPFFKTIPTIAVIGTLAACGGSSTSNPPPIDQSLNLLASEFDTLRDIDVTIDNFASTDLLPTTGTASYDGVISLFEVSGDDAFNADGEQSFGALGTVALEADFDAGTLDGTATNFIEYDNFDEADDDLTNLNATGVADGSLTITATLDDRRNEARFDGTIAGQITRVDGSVADYDLDILGSGFSELDDGSVQLRGFAEGDAPDGSTSDTAGAVFFAD